MKRVLMLIAVGGFMLVVGFFSGRAFQDAKSGYHYRILEQKDYNSGLGPVQWTSGIESVGLPLFDGGTTIIKFGNRTIYKAQCDFQADAPYARNIQTSTNWIAWEDGDYQFHLTVDPLGTQPGTPPDGRQLTRFQTNTTSSGDNSHH
jgi:hypothetical protein